MADEVVIENAAKLDAAWHEYIELQNRALDVVRRKADLLEDPRFKLLTDEEIAVKEALSVAEANVKQLMKDTGTAKMENDDWVAEMKVRKSITLEYNIPAIEAQPWGAAVLTKSVDEKTFKAMVKAKDLKADDYCKEVVGKEVKAVSISQKKSN